ncbi:MAG TPA: hypothetical protein VGP63_21850, partial [Planctomycetaceae bacterium]|nr:hypothetical protein [Planctomycetaceae bacterium]
VLVISSLFWFLGGVIQPSVNAFGRLQMEYGDGRTGALAVCMAIGIAIGCISAGALSRGKFRTGFVTLGAWGVVGCLSALAALGSVRGVALVHKEPTQGATSTGETKPLSESSQQTQSSQQTRTGSVDKGEGESLAGLVQTTSSFETLCRLLLVGVGFFAGLFYVPLAVVMQVRPPADKKGRMIGAMNLVNWICILIAAGFYFAVIAVCQKLQIRLSWIFAMAAAVMLPVALLYRPNVQLRNDAA